MVAALRSLSLDVSKLNINEGMDIVIVSLNCFPPKICSIIEFYPHLKERFERLKKEEERVSERTSQIEMNTSHGKGSLFKQKIRTSEQMEHLVKMGYAVRKKAE